MDDDDVVPKRYAIAIIISQISYKDFQVSFRNLRGNEIHFSLRNPKIIKEMEEWIDEIAQSTFYKDKEGFSNRNLAKFQVLCEELIGEHLYTDACVLFDSPFIDPTELHETRNHIVQLLEFDLDHAGQKKSKAS